ncbi:MAG: hypothetical protein CVU56_29320 [Deltaproteobacteria bacterium HGW-Deltaproteobacteria-14]|nr:MAG: hypothetical protein CVU56_29320 [Deltaproteobacteria bacterium HGW-Deltaproteobacteria-14]
MKLIARIALVLAFALPAAACGKKAETPPAPVEPAAAPADPAAAPADPAAAPADPANTTAKVGLDTGGVALGGEKVKLNAMKFGGTGFDTEYNEALDSWTAEKWTPNEDGGNDMTIRVYVYGWDSEWPTDAAAFAEKLKTKDYLDMGSVWTVEKSEAFEGGWVVLGSSNDGEDNELAFAVRLDKGLLCRGYVQIDVPEANRAAVRDDAIAACKGITLP